MTKEKLQSLTKYLNILQEKQKSPLPEKHKHRPKEYQEFLAREIKAIRDTLEEAKLQEVK